jgi:ABC-type amino acid transport substrate-binding protein
MVKNQTLTSEIILIKNPSLSWIIHQDLTKLKELCIMYRIIGVALLTVISTCSIVACGGSPAATTSGNQTSPAVQTASVESITPEQTIQLLNGKKLGVLTRARSVEEDENDYESQFKNGFNLNLDLAGEVYVANIGEGLQLLRDKKVAAFEILGATAQYVVQKNADLKMYDQEYKPSTVHILFNKSKETQFNQVDAVIRNMMSDGTIKSLQKQYIDLTDETVPTVSSFSHFDGKDTIKIGHTGEEPPLDYLTGSGAPSGYAMAVLREIGSKANLNIELVKVSTADRFTALQSGSIDAFLWKTEMGGVSDYPESKVYSDIDPGVYNFIFTYPYLETSRALITLK